MESVDNYFVGAGLNNNSAVSVTNKFSSKKKMKQTLLIVAVLFLVVIIVVCAFLVFSPKNAHTLFNEYANYLLYGNDSSKDITSDYDWGYRYYANDIDVMCGEDYAEYLEKLRNKYENFYTSYEVPSEYNDVFWLFWYSHMYLGPAGTAVNSENGVEEPSSGISRQELIDYYAPLIDSQYEYVREYAWKEIANYTDDNEYNVADLPDYNQVVFSEIWRIKESIYEKSN